MLWSEKQRQDKLAAVKANYPMADDKINGMEMNFVYFNVFFKVYYFIEAIS